MICLRSRSIDVAPQRLEADKEQLGLLLDQITLPIFLLNGERILVYANLSGHELLEKSNLVNLNMGRFKILGDAFHLSRFDHALRSATLCQSEGSAKSSTMIISNANVPKASITISPFSQLAHSDRLAVVIFTAQDDCEIAVTERLQRSLGLTPSEARVAHLLVVGHRPKEIAKQLGVSVNTVKSHLTSLFSKTGCATQVAFCLLARHLLTPVRMSH